MICPDGVGRESWDRVGQASVGWLALRSPQDWGKKPSPRGTLSGRKSGRPQGKVIVVVVVECYCFLYIYIIVDVTRPRTPPFHLSESITFAQDFALALVKR